jgi:hypothetical protein
MHVLVDQAAHEPVRTLRLAKFESACNASTTAVGRIWLGGDAPWQEALVCWDEYGALTVSRVDVQFKLDTLLGTHDGERFGHAQDVVSPASRLCRVGATTAWGRLCLAGTMTVRGCGGRS